MERLSRADVLELIALEQAATGRRLTGEDGETSIEARAMMLLDLLGGMDRDTARAALRACLRRPVFGLVQPGDIIAAAAEVKYGALPDPEDWQHPAYEDTGTMFESEGRRVRRERAERIDRWRRTAVVAGEDAADAAVGKRLGDGRKLRLVAGRDARAVAEQERAEKRRASLAMAARLEAKWGRGEQEDDAALTIDAEGTA